MSAMYIDMSVENILSYFAVYCICPSVTSRDIKCGLCAPLCESISGDRTTSGDRSSWARRQTDRLSSLALTRHGLTGQLLQSSNMDHEYRTQ